MTTTPSIIEVLANPAVSYWLKDAIRTNLTRDPVDAYYDAELLMRILKERLDEIQGGNK